MIKKVDLRGLACPEPVLKAKRLLDDQTVERLDALVDDLVCVNNLKRLARSLKATATCQEQNGSFLVVIDRSLSAATGGDVTGDTATSIDNESHTSAFPADKAATGSGTVVFLSKDTFGQGDPQFSRTLLDLFLQSMLEAGHAPTAILIANTGVKLLAPESPSRHVLKEFQERGCPVLACGLCVEFYGLKEHIHDSQIINMFAIVEYLQEASKVLTP